MGDTNSAGKIEHKLLSVLVLIVINGANSISTKASTRLNNFFVGTKFVSIFVVVVAGIVVVILGASDPDRDIGGRDWRTKPWFGFRETVNPDGTRIDWSKLTQWDLLGHYSAAIYGALWAYSGWDKVCAANDPKSRTSELMSGRQLISPLSFRRQLDSCHLPSTQLSQQSFCVSSPRMQPTTFSFPGA